MNYYRCQEGTEAYRKLKEVADKVRGCYQAAADLADDLGATSFSLNRLVIGGIGSLRFIRKPDPKAYKVINVTRSGKYKLYDCIPNIDEKEGAEIAVRIMRLPYMKRSEVLKESGGDAAGLDSKVEVEIIPTQEWTYMKSELEHRLDGLVPITKENYEQAEEYYNQYD